MLLIRQNLIKTPSNFLKSNFLTVTYNLYPINCSYCSFLKKKTNWIKTYLPKKKTTVTYNIS